MADLVIKNAKLVLPDGVVEAGIVVEGGRIRQIVKDSGLPEAGKVFDARGKYVFPGVIDAHVHMREPGSSSKEDWVTGSSAAAAGGVTAVLDMPNTQPPTTTKKHLEEKRALVSKKSRVDFGFHFGASLDNLDELSGIEGDVASVKIYMSATTGSLRADNEAIVYEELKILSEKDILATTHAENSHMIHFWSEKLKAKEKPTAEDYADSRPNICASSALNQMIYLSRMAGNRVHFCHVSTLEEVDVLRQQKNSNVTAEATPHHLFLSRDDIKALGSYSKVNPPLRSPVDQEALWNAVHTGVIDLIATDHAPHLPEEKELDIVSASAGFPGLETMLPLLLNEVNRGNISLSEVAKLTANNPARIFNIANKGFIAEGFDADLVVVDLNLKKKVSGDRLYTKCKWTPFEGRDLRGWPTATFVRGNLVFNEGSVLDNSGREVLYSKT